MDPLHLSQRLGRWSAGRGPLRVLLAARLRALIDDGDLPAGVLLPPDRALAAALAVGRGTVVAAYDQLSVEGRVVRRQGSGTRVAGRAVEEPRPTTDAPTFLHLVEPRDGVILLACAAPDAPPPELVDAYGRVGPALAALRGDIGYHPLGLPVLRRAVADRFTRRGTPTSVDQVMVTTGGQQALSLLARALLRPGDRVVVEAPTYSGALEAFRDQAAVPVGLPVGLAGFEAAVRARPALAYVVPVFHNPTGSVLSALRRRRLADVAAAAGVPLVEDEALVDLAFPGADPPPVDQGDRVITTGSLSKVVWAGLRVGWVRAPAALITRLARLRAVHDLGGNVPAQLVAADLLPTLEPLRARQAALREAAHDHLRAELAAHLPTWHAPPVPGGQTLWIGLPHGDAASFAQTALRHGVAVLPGASLGGPADHLRVHFVFPPDVLSEAVRRLAAAWRAYDPPAERVSPAPGIAV
ncbi:PLP-dependent aminotransferase family protein [Actinosynnema sp. NPDC020468]|uniref:aminotransferase-like domain-containing protein n=1 Tax=Actinosynnema sp. NPDC020468 TaxID=3154488 RepID=UPI003409E9B5